MLISSTFTAERIQAVNKWCVAPSFKKLLKNINHHVYFDVTKKLRGALWSLYYLTFTEKEKQKKKKKGGKGHVRRGGRSRVCIQGC